MSLNLPKPIDDYIEANARLDIEGMLKPFLHDAVFIDNGKQFEGQAAIRHLLEKEVIPVKAIFTPDTAREETAMSWSKVPLTALSRAARSVSPIASRWQMTPSKPWRPQYEHPGRSQ